MGTVIRTEQLYRNYSKTGSRKEQPDDIRVLKGIDLSVEEGEFVGIMGKSGCGKTTLIKVLGLIDVPTKGKLYFKRTRNSSGRMSWQISEEERSVSFFRTFI